MSLLFHVISVNKRSAVPLEGMLWHNAPLDMKSGLQTSDSNTPGIDHWPSWHDPMSRDRFTKSLWAHDTKLVEICFASDMKKWWLDHSTIVHMPWQLSCHGMCKNVKDWGIRHKIRAHGSNHWSWTMLAWPHVWGLKSIDCNVCRHTNHAFTVNIIGVKWAS